MPQHPKTEKLNIYFMKLTDDSRKYAHPRQRSYSQGVRLVVCDGILALIQATCNSLKSSLATNFMVGATFRPPCSCFGCVFGKRTHLRVSFSKRSFLSVNGILSHYPIFPFLLFPPKSPTTSFVVRDKSNFAN